MLAKSSLAVLKRRQVTERQYLTWAAGKIARRTRIFGAVFCVTITTMIIAAAIKAGIESPGLTVDQALILSGFVVAVLAFTVGAGLWMHASAVNPLAEGVLHLELRRWCSHAFIEGLATKDWHDIRKAAHRTLRHPSGITHGQLELIERLTPWRQMMGWMSIVVLAISLFASKQLLLAEVLLSMFVVTLGAFFLLQGAQLWIARRFVDHETGVTYFGKPAVLAGAIAIAFGGSLVALGVSNIFLS